MDLHFTNASATISERNAVDSVLGELTNEDKWGNAQTDRAKRHPLHATGQGRQTQRHLLLPVLHAVQDQIGWISPGALNYLCQKLSIPPAEAYGVASFYALFALKPQPQVVLHICDDIVCRAKGAARLCDALEANLGCADTLDANGKALWKRSPCLGLCEKAPAAFCQQAGLHVNNFTVAPVDDATALMNAIYDEASVGRNLGNSTRQIGQPLSLLARVGVADPLSLDAYRSQGGYVALRNAFEIGPARVIAEVTTAKLTGRGGAAFPTGLKWKAVSEAPVQPHYVICNADESEPGTFKDRVLMEEDPFAVVEALTIAGYACGAEQGYIYIRGEYPEATSRLQNALEQCRIRGLLGADILGRGVRFDIEIRRGAGAYICGEETALLNSIEGFRGEPRNKPPFPVQVGLFGKPTAINNVETLLNVLPILTAGGEAYASIGTERSTGTRLFCVSGCVERPGVYEVPSGTLLRQLLSMAGGVRGGRKLQTILMGGAAGVFIRPEDIDMPLTLEGARAANATLGSGVVLVLDDTVDLKAILLRIAAFFRDESCGQCVPCRVGTVRQEEALHRLFAASEFSRSDRNLLDELEQVMRDASICGLGQTAGSAILSALQRLELFSGDNA